MDMTYFIDNCAFSILLTAKQGFQVGYSTTFSPSEFHLQQWFRT